jgi:hypothetical protein
MISMVAKSDAGSETCPLEASQRPCASAATCGKGDDNLAGAPAGRQRGEAALDLFRVLLVGGPWGSGIPCRATTSGVSVRRGGRDVPHPGQEPSSLLHYPVRLSNDDHELGGDVLKVGPIVAGLLNQGVATQRSSHSQRHCHRVGAVPVGARTGLPVHLDPPLAIWCLHHLADVTSTRFRWSQPEPELHRGSFTIT